MSGYLFILKTNKKLVLPKFKILPKIFFVLFLILTNILTFIMGPKYGKLTAFSNAKKSLNAQKTQNLVWCQNPKISKNQHFWAFGTNFHHQRGT